MIIITFCVCEERAGLSVGRAGQWWIDLDPFDFSVALVDFLDYFIIVVVGGVLLEVRASASKRTSLLKNL